MARKTDTTQPAAENPTAALQKRRGDWMKLTDRIEIENDDDFLIWAERSKIGTELIRAWEKYWDDARSKSHAAWQAIVKGIADYANPLKRRVGMIDSALGDYRREKDRRIREQQQKQLEAQRKTEQQAMVNQVEQLTNEGRNEEADLLLQAAATHAPALPVPSEDALPAVAGMSFVDGWDFEITDERMIPRAYLIPDEKKIRKVVDALGLQANIPGVAVKASSTVRKKRS